MEFKWHDRCENKGKRKVSEDNRKEDAMKTIMRVIAILGITTSLALAGEGGETMGTSLFVILFLGFGALIIVCQLIPGLMLFCSMMKGLFGKAVKETLPATDETEGNV